MMRVKTYPSLPILDSKVAAACTSEPFSDNLHPYGLYCPKKASGWSRHCVSARGRHLLIFKEDYSKFIGVLILSN